MCVNPPQWPQDFESLDGGRVRVSRRYLPLFASLGWHTFEDVYGTTRTRRMRTIAQRENCWLDIPDPDTGDMMQAYMKRHDARDLCGYVICMLEGQPWRAAGYAEADAVGVCSAAGIDTMQVIAAGAACGDQPWKARSFFISQAIPDATPSDDFWLEQIQGDDVRGAALIDALADTARCLHDAGLFHRDLYWCHFMTREPAPGDFHIRLIDVQRLVRKVRWLRGYARLKDLAQFYRSAPMLRRGGPTAGQLRRWFARYRQKDALRGLDRLRFALVRLRTGLYRLKDQQR